jgi:hypothetical protein
MNFNANTLICPEYLNIRAKMATNNAAASMVAVVILAGLHPDSVIAVDCVKICVSTNVVSLDLWFGIQYL